MHAGQPHAVNAIDQVPSITLRFQVMPNLTDIFRDGLGRDGSPLYSEFSLCFPICQEYQTADGKSATIQNFKYQAVSNIKKTKVPLQLRNVLQKEDAEYRYGAVCLEWDCEAAVREEDHSREKYRKHYSKIKADTLPAIKTCLQLFPKIATGGGHIRLFVHTGNHEAMDGWREGPLAQMLTSYRAIHNLVEVQDQITGAT